jgi:hypothetical protein
VSTPRSRLIRAASVDSVRYKSLIGTKVPMSARTISRYSVGACSYESGSAPFQAMAMNR